jgi:hypothetical protein
MCRVTFKDEEIRKDLLAMKKSNLEEARDMIRKCLGMPKPEVKKEPALEAAKDRTTSAKLPDDQELLGNAGVNKACARPDLDLDHDHDHDSEPKVPPRSDVPPGASKSDDLANTGKNGIPANAITATNNFTQYAIIGGVVVLVCACFVAYLLLFTSEG